MWNRWLILAIVVVLTPIVLLALMSLFARRPVSLGVKDGRFAPCPDSPNCISTQAEDADHRIEPISFTGPVGEVWTRLKKVVAAMPRTRTVTETEDYLHVEWESLIFRFVDDVEFWIDGPHKVIHFRSASRAGRSDLGVNRDRMESVRKAFLEATKEEGR